MFATPEVVQGSKWVNLVGNYEFVVVRVDYDNFALICTCTWNRKYTPAPLEELTKLMEEDEKALFKQVAF